MGVYSTSGRLRFVEPAIQALNRRVKKDVDARDKRGQDVERRAFSY
jgi:hypothetical protein